MSVLCERPDTEFFHTIPDLHDAVITFNENDVETQLERFGSIFVKHGVTNDFGLAMVHRHFDISKEEVLVETLNDQKSVSVTSPWIMKDETLIAPDNDTLWIEHETKMKQHVVPQTWSFDKSGNLKAFEYLATDSPMDSPPASFAAELYAELKRLGLEGILGLRRTVNVRGRSSWEVTPNGTRSNVVVFGTKPDTIENELLVTVLWCFDEKGNVRTGAHCYGCQHCTHCRHCGHCKHY